MVSKEYSELLRGHPQIHQVFEFDRKSGFRGWYQLAQKLWDEKYTDVYDLHRSRRPRVLRLFFILWSVKEGTGFPRWRTHRSKSSSFSFILFLRDFGQKSFVRNPLFNVFPSFLGGTGQERPNLKHLLLQQKLPDSVAELQVKGLRYISVMPSSRWMGRSGLWKAMLRL